MYNLKMANTDGRNMYLYRSNSKRTIRNIVVFFTIYICTNNLYLLFDNTTGMTHLKIRKLAFQLAVQNKIPSQFSIAKETAGKDWFKHCKERHGDKRSLHQPTGTSTARATRFSKAQVGIFFDLYKKSLLLMITHLHVFSM